MSTITRTIALNSNATEAHALYITGLHRVWYSVTYADSTTKLEPLGALPVKDGDMWAYADHADWYASLVDEPTASPRIVAALVDLLGRDLYAADYSGHFAS